jgi:hypothetical protein
MPTTKNQPAYRNATTQTDDIADLLLATVTIGAVTADAGTSLLVFNDGVNDVFASSAAPLPVTATGTVAATQSGTWTVTGAGGTFPVTGTFWQATQPVSGTVDLGATDNAVLDTSASPVVTRGAALPASAQALGVAVDGDVVQMPFAITTFADGVSYVGAYHLSTASHNYMFNGLTFDRMRGDTTNGLDVDVTRSALPSGASTSALQTTGNTSLAAIRTAVETIDNAISGNEMQVDVLTVPADPFGADADAASATGSISAKLRFIASTGIPITGTASVSTAAIDAFVHDTAWSSGASGFGTFLRASAAAPTDVGADDRDVAAWALRNGAQCIQPTLGGILASTGTGASGTGTQRIVTATDSSINIVSTLTGSGVAHDGADSGNPHKIGAKAKSSLSAITLVSADDRTDLFADLDGIQVTRPHCHLGDIVSGVAAITDGSSTSVIASQGAGVKTYITSVVIANTSATAVTVDIRDGAAGSVKLTLPVPADTAGVVFSLPVPLPFSAATAVCADPSAAASTVTVSLIGFRSKV